MARSTGAARRTSRTGRKVKSAETKGGLVRFMLTLALVAWALRSLIVAPFSIPSGSMLPTLYIGDYLMVAKWPYGYSTYSFPFDFPKFDGRIFSHDPARGDVVVFRHPAAGEDLIKRVIGIPGDTIEMRDGQLILNGKPVTRTRIEPVAIKVSANSPCRTIPPAQPDVRQGQCYYPAYRETLPGGPSYVTLDQVHDGAGDSLGPVTVPAGHVFMMGDNRDDSLDSRFDTTIGGVGMVPVDHLIGRAMVNFWSTDGNSTTLNPISWFTSLRARRIGNGYTVADK